MSLVDIQPPLSVDRRYVLSILRLFTNYKANTSKHFVTNDCLILRELIIHWTKYIQYAVLVTQLGWLDATVKQTVPS